MTVHAAGLVQDVLAQTDGIQVRVTSRQALGLVGEQVHKVPPLGVPASGTEQDQDSTDMLAGSDAVRLLVDRVTSARPGFRVDEGSLRIFAELARRLDGLPHGKDCPERNKELVPLPMERILAASCLCLAVSIVPRLHGRTQDSYFEILELERSNFATTLKYFINEGAVADALELCSALHWFWYCKGHFSEGTRALMQALSLFEDYSSFPPTAGTVPVRVVIDARHAYGWLLFVQGNWKSAVDHFRQCLVHSRACRYDEGEAHALEGLGDLYCEKEHYVEAAVHFEAALGTFRRLDDSWMTAWSLEGLGRTLLHRSTVQESIKHLIESFRLFLTLGDQENACFVLGHAASAVFSAGQEEHGARLMGCCHSSLRQSEAGVQNSAMATFAEVTELSRKNHIEAWTRGCLDDLQEAADMIEQYGYA